LGYVERRNGHDHTKIVMARLDRAIQEHAHQAFVAPPLDCPVKPGNDDFLLAVTSVRR
jgi:hypothetical protein